MGSIIAIAVVIGMLTGAFLTLALALRSETKRAGEQAARADVLELQLQVANTNTKTEAARADFEKRRGDALDAAIVDAVAAGPVDGSFERLLQARQAARAADGEDADELHHAGPAGDAAGTVGPDGLLDPFP